MIGMSSPSTSAFISLRSSRHLSATIPEHRGYIYDYCGDTDIGERYRKFYRRLLETCDLSPYQRSVIRQNFEWATEVIPSTIAAPRRLRALPIDPNSDEAAPRLFGGRYRRDEAYYRGSKPEAEAELDEVEQGQPAPDTMMPGPCKK